jgi:CspA family cold shock protein
MHAGIKVLGWASTDGRWSLTGFSGGCSIALTNGKTVLQTMNTHLCRYEGFRALAQASYVRARDQKWMILQWWSSLQRDISMLSGKVKWFNNAKGYGFILADGRDEDLFAHYSAIQMDGYKTLKAGQAVSFDIIQGPKGLHAVNISALSATTEALAAASQPHGNTVDA